MMSTTYLDAQTHVSRQARLVSASLLHMSQVQLT